MRAQHLPSFAASHRLIIAAVAHQIKKRAPSVRLAAKNCAKELLSAD
jgi:hypothetical protein